MTLSSWLQLEVGRPVVVCSISEERASPNLMLTAHIIKVEDSVLVDSIFIL